MLKKIRITLGALFCLGVTLLFLDITGVLHLYLGWMAQLQLLPAILSGSVIIVAVVLLLTLLFGRFYCSVICPLGVLQDGFFVLGTKWGKKNRFHFTKAHNLLRYIILGLVALGLILGLSRFVGLLDPYSNYGRIASQLFRPLYVWVNNLLALLAENLDSYAFYSAQAWVGSLLSLIVAAVVFLVVAFCAFKKGRILCNTICPVGALLSLFSRYALFRPTIDVSKCNGCTKCARNCKASCIDPEHHTIDTSRCVDCMDCLSNCKQGAISFRPVGWSKKDSKGNTADKNQSVDASRRKFVVTTAALATSATLMAQEKKVDGGLAVIEDKQVPERTTPLHPAGSVSLRHFSSHCTSCQLCVAECPSHVLRPSAKLATMMQPEMGFEKGYCQPDCTRCGEVCPAGAIRPFSIEEKASRSVGYAVVRLDSCVAFREGVSCGTCARHCPAGAIRMVSRDASVFVTDENLIRIPSIDENRCLGCGACEYYCPSRPFSAITIEGRQDVVTL